MQFDFCSFATATTGQAATITAGAAVSGFRTLATCNGGTFPPDGTPVEYTISDGVNKESCTGVTGGSGTTLTRILSQSTTGALLNLSGNAVVSLNPISSRYNALGAGTVSAVSARIRRTADQAIPVGAGFTDIEWQAVGHQIGETIWSLATPTQLVAQSTAIREVKVEATFSPVGLIGTVTAKIQLLCNGAVIGADEQQVIAGAKASLIITAERPFNTGDIFIVQATHDNASPLSILAEGTHSPDIIITVVGGAQGQASPYNYGLTAAIGAGQFLN